MLSMRSAADVSAAATAACDRLLAVGGGRLRLLTPPHPLQLPEALRHLGQFVGDGERRHDGQPRSRRSRRIWYAGPRCARSSSLREIRSGGLLAVLAGHAELPAVDGDVDLGHCPHPRMHSGASTPVGSQFAQHAADCLDRLRRSAARHPDWRLQTRGIAPPPDQARWPVARDRCRARGSGSRALPRCDRSRRAAPLHASSASSASARRRLAISIESVSLIRPSSCGRWTCMPHGRKSCDGNYLCKEPYVASSKSVNAQSIAHRRPVHDATLPVRPRN